MSSTGQTEEWIARPEFHLLFRYDGEVKNSLHGRFGAGRWIVAVVVLSLAGNAQKPTPKATSAVLDCGALAGQELRCPQLGFTYKVPFGWVDRTEDLQSTSEAAEASAPAGASQQGAKSAPQSSGGKTLLAVFQRPPEAPGTTINSAVIIAAEPVSYYPKVKTAADYFGPLGEIAEQRGLKMDGDSYSFAVGTRQLARGDFSAGGDKAPVRQTSLVAIEKGYILSFTFVSSNEDEIEDLISGLSFGVRGPTNPDHRK